jgi:hypothetical protein
MEGENMRGFLLAALVLLAGCAVEDIDAAVMAEQLDANITEDLAPYVVDVTTNGRRVRVHTQLDESQVTEAEAICNLTTVAGYGMDVSGVDVAAAGGRNIAACQPRV